MPSGRTSALPKATGRDISTGKVLTLVKSQPAQLSLFQMFFPEQDSDYYSNTIELYDAIPKYFSSKKRVAELRKDGVFLKSLSRRFRHKDQWYDLIVKPARIVDRHGNEKEYYPTHQEELVEEALKKIACDRLNGVFLNDTAGVQFTLYELDKELRSQEHAMKGYVRGACKKSPQRSERLFNCLDNKDLRDVPTDCLMAVCSGLSLDRCP